MGRPKKAPAAPDLEQLHEVDEIQGATLVAYADPEGTGWAGWFEADDAPGTVVGYEALDGTVMVENPPDDEPDPAQAAADETAATEGAATKRKRTRRSSSAPKRKKGDQVRLVFTGPGPATRECTGTVVRAGKDGRLDLEVDPMGNGNTQVREAIPWGDGKTSDTWH